MGCSPFGAFTRRISALTLARPYWSAAVYSSRRAARWVAAGGVAKAIVGAVSGTIRIAQAPIVRPPWRTSRRSPDIGWFSSWYVLSSTDLKGIVLSARWSWGTPLPPCTRPRSLLPTGTFTVAGAGGGAVFSRAAVSWAAVGARRKMGARPV